MKISDDVIACDLWFAPPPPPSYACGFGGIANLRASTTNVNRKGMRWNYAARTNFTEVIWHFDDNNLDFGFHKAWRQQAALSLVYTQQVV